MQQSPPQGQDSTTQIQDGYLGSKQTKVLDALFGIPTRTDIRWDEVRALFEALGATVAEGRGSRVRVLLNDRKAVFHKPHPQPEVHRYAVKQIQLFLESAGISPKAGRS